MDLWWFDCYDGEYDTDDDEEEGYPYYLVYGEHDLKLESTKK